MRYLTIIILSCLFALSCVKKSPKDPIPVLEYKDFQAWQIGSDDTALLTISYNDFDGDLFTDASSEIPNTVLRTYIFNADSNKLIKDKIISYIIQQPGDGFYKDKAIKGDIIIPMRQFRPDNTVKIMKFEVYMVDTKDNKSNVVSTPQVTLNF